MTEGDARLVIGALISNTEVAVHSITQEDDTVTIKLCTPENMVVTDFNLVEPLEEAAPVCIIK